jgi:molybdopterin-containing oxidoreductase family iron-sulfur binding subunit
VPRLALWLLAELARNDARARLPGLSALGELPSVEGSEHAAWVRALADDLLRHWGTGLVLAGPQQSLATHALALALNGALGSFGRTLRLTAPALLEPAGAESLGTLRAAIDQGEVDALLVLDCDPVYGSDPELGLEAAFARVPLTVQLTSHSNATSRACRWLLPLSHYLESWGDSRALDGTVSQVQPLLEPLHASRSLLEVVAACAGAPRPNGHALVQAHWRSQLGVRSVADFDAQWATRLQHGLQPGSAFPELRREPDWGRLLTLARTALTPAPRDGYELSLPVSPSVYDGRFAHNAWLLELPDPITKQMWGNALRISAEDASRLGLSTGSVVELSRVGRAVRAPVLVAPGQAPGTLALALGFGQSGSGTLGDGVGVDAGLLRAATEGAFLRVQLRATSQRARLAIRQQTQDQQGRGLALATSLAAYRQDPSFTRAARGPQASLLPVLQQASTGPLAGLQWGMTIDTTLCTGCSACVIACQAENNVPVVGPREAARGHEMHWLRIDSYAAEAQSPVGVIHQPMLCQHCEAAPCEYVCPVNATVHSPDGLNEMVYNRCIGTRFCSNNCPYKVRRFNWFDYADDDALARLQKNPEVTVRERGVMEKCTYCVQRIRGAERQARIERREVAPGGGGHGLPASLPDAGDPVRRAQPRRHSHGRVAAGAAPLLRIARARHAAPAPSISPRSRTRTRSCLDERRRAAAVADVRRRVARQDCLDHLEPARLGVSSGAARERRRHAAAPYCVSYTVARGIGLWGNQIPVAWAFGIINFVWWIGIGHAGTFISAILYLFEQTLARCHQPLLEAMTLFAVLQAALFPLLTSGGRGSVTGCFPIPPRCRCGRR